jgi:hypothetical protein
MFRRPAGEGVATDCMQMRAVTTCERFITFLLEGFTVFFYCATSGTEERLGTVTRESWFRFAGGHIRRSYNLEPNVSSYHMSSSSSSSSIGPISIFAPDAPQPKAYCTNCTWFSPVRTVLPPPPHRLSSFLIPCFTDCQFLSPNWLWFLTFWSAHCKDCTCRGQYNVNVCGHTSLLSSGFELKITELDKSKTACTLDHSPPTAMSSPYRL